MKIHREGFRFIAIASVLWLGIGFLTINYLTSVLWLVIIINLITTPFWFWVVWFFRLPDRKMTMSGKYVIAPADGKVVVIEEVYEQEYFKDMRLQVSIFMSPLNVHINRSPINGTVKFLRYHPGLYLVAWHPKSSTENERTTIVIGNSKYDILIRQIAGAVARRICCYVQAGDPIIQNQEIGFIRFGSRVDVYLPLGTKTNVKIGDVVEGGVSILATDVVDLHKRVEPDYRVFKS